MCCDEVEPSAGSGIPKDAAESIARRNSSVVLTAGALPPARTATPRRTIPRSARPSALRWPWPIKAVSWRGGRITMSARLPSTTMVWMAAALPKLITTRLPPAFSTIAGSWVSAGRTAAALRMTTSSALAACPNNSGRLKAAASRAGVVNRRPFHPTNAWWMRAEPRETIMLRRTATFAVVIAIGLSVSIWLPSTSANAAAPRAVANVKMKQASKLRMPSSVRASGQNSSLSKYQRDLETI